MQATYVKGCFVEVMGGEGRAGLQELPEDVLRDLLESEELETQSEMQVLEVMSFPCAPCAPHHLFLLSCILGLPAVPAACHQSSRSTCEMQEGLVGLVFSCCQASCRGMAEAGLSTCGRQF